MESSLNDRECTGDENCICESCVTPYKGKPDKGRGATRMSWVARARNRGIQYNVQFNERGQPIGEYSDKMMSYWGSIAKKFIPIVYNDWKQIPDNLKDALFEDLARKSEANRQRGKGNIYPQKKGRRGCARFEQDLIAKRKKEGQIVSSIRRGELWKLMRSDEEENVTESAKEIVDRIDDLQQRVREGEFDDIGRKDVLQRALKKKEPSGRVWAAGKGVSQTTYFGSSTTEKEYKTEVIDVKARVKRLEQEIMLLKSGRPKDIANEGNFDESCHDDDALKNYSPTLDDHALKDSSPILNDDDAMNSNKSSHIPEGVTECELALSEPKYRVVAIGKVYNTGEVVHTQPLPVGFLRVSIDCAIEHQTPLPVPNQDADAFVISDAIGTLVLWPTKLIVINVQENIRLETNDKVNSDSHSWTPSKRVVKEFSLPPTKKAKEDDSSHATSKYNHVSWL